MTQELGHRIYGQGAHRVIVLNDWLGDTTIWDHAQRYLNTNDITWAMADLRGYGRSRHLPGPHTAAQGASDVLSLAKGLGWDTFSIVGHSMSTLVAWSVAQQAPQSVQKLVLLTPPGPKGFDADQNTLGWLRSLARTELPARIEQLSQMWGQRLSAGWVRHKASRWIQNADPEAVAAYVDMFATEGVTDHNSTIDQPTLLLTGKEDAPHMQAQVTVPAWTPMCANMTTAAMDACGHYPMEEAPPLLVTHLERFLL